MSRLISAEKDPRRRNETMTGTSPREIPGSWTWSGRLAVLAMAITCLLALLACDEHVTGVPGDSGAGGDGSAIKCGPGTVPCQGQCTNLGTDNRNCGACGSKCDDGQGCVAGKCTSACPAGQIICSGTCVDLKTDTQNCGVCSTVCKINEVCAAGKCSANCGASLTEFSGKCVNTTKDR